MAISLGATQADGYGSSENCWLDVPSGLIWAFIAPAILIILVSGSYPQNFSLTRQERDKRQNKGLPALYYLAIYFSVCLFIYKTKDVRSTTV